MSSPDKKPATFFSSAYKESESALLSDIRHETYDEDIGQFSWTTADEFRRFLQRLELQPRSHLLDVACGSGGPALFAAQSTGCRVTGVDINESGIATARQAARARALQDRVVFEQIDARRSLPFADNFVDAIISIDALNHFFDRAALFDDWHRVLRPGGRFLFTDAVIVTGLLSRDEIVARSSSMGDFIFTPAGNHERAIEAAGFTDLEVEDVTETIASVAKRWHDARARRREELLKIEFADAFENLQKMLAAAHLLSDERRLSRFAYSARKAAAA
jgi:cyclopropane fatty-acyl-phospholipid synthase-like methyltransferase